MAEPIRLIRPGEVAVPGGWRVSDWDAGQSSVLRWAPGNVREAGGAVELVLDRAPPGLPRPWAGGEVQSVDAATTGTWWWRAQAPRLLEGAVWALFAYRADHDRDPWVEFDWEFLGRDAWGGTVTTARLNIHMATGPLGERRTLEEAGGGPVIVDLRRACGGGFDAAGTVHLYQVTVTGRDATFAIDGRMVGRFSARDMGGLWRFGPMRGFASLWCAGPELEGWAGRWADPGQPLVGRLAAAGHAPLKARPSRLGALFRGLRGR